MGRIRNERGVRGVSKVRLGGAVALGAIMLAPHHAVAQDSENRGPGAPAQAQTEGYDEIIVTARKRAENIQSTPISITAVSAAQLESKNAVDLTAIQNAAPGVTIRAGGGTSGAGFTPLISIRGLGQTDYTINTDPAVGIYIDGVYLGRSLGSILDLADVERVEVLRGPQGTLFGRNSIGGAVSVVSKAPSFSETSGTLSLTGGSREFLQARGSLNLPITETLALRVSGMARHREGYVDALQYDDFKLGGEKVWGARAALRFQPTPTLTIDLSVDHTKRNDTPAPVVALRLGDVSEEQSGPTGQPSTFFNSGRGPAATAVLPWISTDAPRCATDAAFRRTSPTCFGDAWLGGTTGSNSVWFNRAGERIRPENTFSVTGYGGTITLETGIGTFKSITSYREFESTFFNDLDYSPFVILHNNHEEPRDGGAPFGQRQFSQELQLVGTAFDRLDYVFGGYYFHEKGEEASDTLVPGNVPAAVAAASAPFLPYFSTSSRSIDNMSKALYAQFTFAATERLKLTAGVRYTDETKDYEVVQFRAVGNPTVATGRQGTNIWTPMFNIAWQATDDVMAYANYSEGYRAGGFAGRFAGTLTSPLPSFDPEYVTSYELGLKSSLFDRRLIFNLSAYQMDYDDIQVSATTPNLPGFVLNLAAARFRGFEAEMRAILGGGFMMTGSAGYIHKELTRIRPGTTVDGGSNIATVITTDHQLPGPAWQLNGELSHRLEFAGGGRLDTAFDVHFESADVNAVTNRSIIRQGAYAEAGARIAYTLPSDRLTLTLGARNLFDKSYFTQKSMTSVSGAAFGAVARPREVYLQATYRFGS
ncbi:MAG: hypothetical protein DI569_00170 [Sphingopyxis macrogoltabida]|uniref:TonB-dependent receptor n=1 Tax=Sphingopyxis macrogoltabida TaxID=33050 RepID=A0A2W5N3K5_SPHMC|nr:MAG: hypothetical protein DI569_00170 [Sphingopyxis macrogoltabida]